MLTYGANPYISSMQLFGKYSYERLVNTLQGYFMFKYLKDEDLYILNLFMLQFRIKPETYLDIYLIVRNDAPNKKLLHIVGT